MEMWQRSVVGHVQMTFIVNQSNHSIPDSESWKLACMENFNWLAKFPEMEITKVICTWPTTSICQMFIRYYNERLYCNQIESIVPSFLVLSERPLFEDTTESLRKDIAGGFALYF